MSINVSDMTFAATVTSRTRETLLDARHRCPSDSVQIDLRMQAVGSLEHWFYL